MERQQLRVALGAPPGGPLESLSDPSMDRAAPPVGEPPVRAGPDTDASSRRKRGLPPERSASAATACRESGTSSVATATSAAASAPERGSSLSVMEPGSSDPVKPVSWSRLETQSNHDRFAPA